MCEMTAKRYILILLLVIPGWAGLSAQAVFNYPGMFFAPVPSADAYYHPRDAFAMNLMQPGQFHLDMDMGTSFSSMGGFGNASSYYLAPRFSYQASERFRLTGGVVFSNSRTNASFAVPGMEGTSLFSGPMQSMLVYASGQYMVNNRLMISGTAYKNIVPGMENGNGQNLFMQNMNYQGMSMSLDYRLTKGISLGASFHYDNRPFGFGYSPYGFNRGFLPAPWRY